MNVKLFFTGVFFFSFIRMLAQSGLIACYSLDNNANDLSGNNYNGTASNVTPTTDRFGNPNGAYYFSGSGSSIQIPYSNFLLNTYTYSVWCRPLSHPSSTGYCLLSIGSTNGYQALNLDNNSIFTPTTGFTAISWVSSTQRCFCHQGFLPALEQWYHLVMTRDSLELQLYINGALCYNGSVSGNPAYLGSLSANIGSRLTSFFQNFHGDIDDVRIYNRVLSRAEVLNMNPSCVASGIDERSENNVSLIISPNPLTSSSTLQLTTQLKDAEVVIYDVLGKEMMRKKLTGDRMEIRPGESVLWRIERGGLVSGVYVVRVRSEERQWTQKIMVQ